MSEPAFELLEKGIYRLKVPFEAVWTSVFLLRNAHGSLLLDAAATDEDVQKQIVPALGRLGIRPGMILCSHLHEDHSGGMPALLAAFPGAAAGLVDGTQHYAAEIRRLKDGDLLLGQFRVLQLPGHTPDCMGILDTASNTLLSCDCLQQLGLDKYPTSVPFPAAYHTSIDKLRQLPIAKIIFSHDYEPFGWCVSGSRQIADCYDLCLAAAEKAPH